MTKVVVAMSMSLDGIAGPESADADGMALFTAILGWQFPLRSWRQEQGMDGGEDSVDSRVWAENFARFGPQVIGRTMFDFGYPNWGENPPFHAPVFVVTHRGQERIAPLPPDGHLSSHAGDSVDQGLLRMAAVCSSAGRKASSLNSATVTSTAVPKWVSVVSSRSSPSPERSRSGTAKPR
jgi:dihydrofolate reductase